MLQYVTKVSCDVSCKYIPWAEHANEDVNNARILLGLPKLDWPGHVLGEMHAFAHDPWCGVRNVLVAIQLTFSTADALWGCI